MSTVGEGFRISNYLLKERIGAGSFGEVWRAQHHIFDEVVAVKIPTEPQFVRNLQREGVTIHGLRHPNIVRAIDLDPYGDPPYLIMEYVDGPSLRQAVDHWGGRFPIPAAVCITRGILCALEAAHTSDVIHRDIKPGNVLLSHPLEQLATISEQSVKVTDFGLGRVGGMTAEAMLQSGSLRPGDSQNITGTAAYMSPEQKLGQQVDARSDLYACGVVLFEMLTGERPQGLETPSAVRPDVPKILDDVFRRSYCRLEGRYTSAREMCDALARGLPMDHAAPIQHEATPQPPPAPEVATERCPDCQCEVQRDDQFCIGCGRQLVKAVPTCHQCSATVQAEDRYCIACGAELDVRTA